VIQDRAPDLERHRHADPVDLGQDVLREVGLDVQVLNLRQMIVGLGLTVYIAEQIARPIIRESAPHVLAQDRVLVVRAERADREEVRVDEIARDVGEKRLAPENWRQIVGLRIQGAERREQTSAQRPGHEVADEILTLIEPVAAIAREILVPAIP
jgi:hypothetical protein